MRIPPVAQLAFCFALAGSLSAYIPILNFYSPNWLVALEVLAGVAFLLPAVFSFIRHKTTVNPQSPNDASTLVIDGIFGISRNPMYVGMLLLVLAFVLWLGALSSFIAVAIFYTSIDRFQIRDEERSLREKFGEAFDEYAARVPRWLFFKKGV
ncbi:isoprenylcysteine carboxylmethyltransferase family protein [Ahrensia sp. 13_GOM-1096m]|jgi:protein-S-isoprenylcysteine O-methyltransferase Ste14|uniref:methyltransferase family protein n=1 Tax=Ahrensia sp. 13_GOM-1096m TaxID=1380380 RepID=UPI00047A08A7|nr:isoprenylcysteine carboxylmethyltransferase family protein [Ahrensia sp. 13_GOM-1096m]